MSKRSFCLRDSGAVAPSAIRVAPNALPLRQRHTCPVRGSESSQLLSCSNLLCGCSSPLPRRARQGIRARILFPTSRESLPMKARVFVTLKNGVLDPQGKAIHHALEGLGFSGINDVRAGKMIELDLAESTSDASIEEMCRKLLANTVIENFRVERG